jgi:hypothetical protein
VGGGSVGTDRVGGGKVGVSFSFGRLVIVGGMLVEDGATVAVLDGGGVEEKVNVRTKVAEGADVDVIVAVATWVSVVNIAENASTVSALSVPAVGVPDPPTTGSMMSGS